MCEMRRALSRWGARRICFELRRNGVAPVPLRARVYRVLVRNRLVDAQAQQHKRRYRRWERELAMELWQLDIVDGMTLANGRACKIVTGIDDHSRFMVIAAVVARPTGRAVCAAFTAACTVTGRRREALTGGGHRGGLHRTIAARSSRRYSSSKVAERSSYLPAAGSGRVCNTFGLTGHSWAPA